MTLTNDDVAAGVRRYLDLVATGTADQIAALYAEDATIEDPVGAEVLRGREAIRAFYATIEDLTQTTTLIALRGCAGQAAFQFEILTETGDVTARMSPMEVMVFGGDGLISSMRAWWADSDLTFE